MKSSSSQTVLFVGALIALTACSDKPVNDPAHHTHQPAVVASADTTKRHIMLSERQVALANITVETVGKGSLDVDRTVNARLQVNPEQTSDISSRASGRIEKLYVKEVGRPVTKGQPLYDLYSETLLTLQREYLMAQEQYNTLGQQYPRYKNILDAARHKLLQYGLTTRQVESLTTAKVMVNHITFLSPAAGVTTDVAAEEGAYVSEGQSLYALANVNSLWVEAELFPDEARLLKKGSTLYVQPEQLPRVDATVLSIHPEYRAGTQLVIVRAEIKKAGAGYVPGMQAQVILPVLTSNDDMKVPVDAVIRSERGNVVFVETQSNTFVSRPVITGDENNDMVVVTSGLRSGEKIAVTGAYLLYSEWALRGL